MEIEEAAVRLKDHIVLCGLDGLGLRTLEELRRLGEKVVVISAPGERFLPRAKAQGVTVVEGNYREEHVLREAGVATASGMAIAEDDDVGNLHAALTAQDINPELRIVVRMFNQELGQRIEALFHDCSALSSSALAAPGFVSAALHENWEQRVEIAGHSLAVRRAAPDGAGVLLPLAHVHGNEPVEFFPRDGGNPLCLVDEGPAMESNSARRDNEAGAYQAYQGHGRLSALGRLGELASSLVTLARTADVRLRYLVAVLVAMGLISTLVFVFFDNLTLVDAVYFTVTIITTTGFGDISLLSAPAALKIFGILLMVLGATTLTLFYALITDAIVSARLARALGGMHKHMENHVVVCGLGNIGYRVVEQIVKLGVPVAAVEMKENGHFIPAVQRMGVPVLIADARMPETLRALNVGKARSVVVATDNDIANLETALGARALNPSLRVVLRLFEPDLAERVERVFGIHISRSVSALAAPAFAAATAGRRVIATIPTGPRVLMVAQVPIEPDSWADGETIAGLESSAEGRVLLLADDGKQRWRPAAETLLAAGQELTVVVTRRGLAEILDLAGGQGP
jgi:Trk K+ transport system NAD-binding subunit